MQPANLTAVEPIGAGLSLPSRFSRVDASVARRRGVALALTILVHLLLLLLVLLSRAPLPPRKAEERLTTFSVMPDPAKKEAGAKKEAPQKSADAAAAAPTVEPPRTPPPVAPVPTVPKTEVPPSFIQISPRDFAAADLSRLPGRGTAGASGANGAGNSGAVAGPGEGPGGARLIAAEWVREPTKAELAPFLPADMPANAGAYLACRTIERYHVENCQVMWENPPGLGLGRGLRRAAWQFLVRPLHLDGQSLVGKDIGIYFTWHETEPTPP